jgi:hypothetical protein
MTPSRTIVQDAVQPLTAWDKKGRKIITRRLTALDTLRLFKAAGAVLSQNESWLAMAALAFAVMEIDGVPVPTPASESQIEGLVDRLAEDGLAAIAKVLNTENDTAENEAQVGNLPGTQF